MKIKKRGVVKMHKNIYTIIILLCLVGDEVHLGLFQNRFS